MAAIVAGRATRAVRKPTAPGGLIMRPQSRRQHMRAIDRNQVSSRLASATTSLLNVVHASVSMRVRLFASASAGRSSPSRARSLLSCIRGERRGASGGRRDRTAMECRARSAAGDVRSGHSVRIDRARGLQGGPGQIPPSELLNEVVRKIDRNPHLFSRMEHEEEIVEN